MKVVPFNSKMCLVSNKNAKQKIVITDFLKNGLEGHFSWFFSLFSPMQGHSLVMVTQIFLLEHASLTCGI